MPEITVASTTDEQKNIDAAAGVIEEPKVVPEGEEPETEPASEAAEHKESKSAVQKRIDKLTREKYEYKNKFETLEQRLAALEQGKTQVKEETAKEEKVTEPDDPEPEEESFDDYKKFVKALSAWQYRQERKAEQAKEAENRAKQSEQQKVQAVYDKYNERVTEAQERYDDFDDVVGKSTPIPQSVVLAIIEMDNGPDVAYYLGKHPEICKKLVGMGQLSAVAEVGRISANLTPTEEVEEGNERITVPKVPTRAKEPIRPVSGSSTKSSIPLDELPYAEYARIRAKQEKERYRR